MKTNRFYLILIIFACNSTFANDNENIPSLKQTEKWLREFFETSEVNFIEGLPKYSTRTRSDGITSEFFPSDWRFRVVAASFRDCTNAINVRAVNVPSSYYEERRYHKLLRYIDRQYNWNADKIDSIESRRVNFARTLRHAVEIENSYDSIQYSTTDVTYSYRDPDDDRIEEEYKIQVLKTGNSCDDCSYIAINKEHSSLKKVIYLSIKRSDMSEELAMDKLSRALNHQKALCKKANPPKADLF